MCSYLSWGDGWGDGGGEGDGSGVEAASVNRRAQRRMRRGHDCSSSVMADTIQVAQLQKGRRESQPWGATQGEKTQEGQDTWKHDPVEQHDSASFQQAQLE